MSAEFAGKGIKVNVYGVPVPRIPMHYTADISTHDGWWFRYRVDRLHGVFVPENTTSHHRTLQGAQRAARRWTRRNNDKPTIIVERHGY